MEENTGLLELLLAGRLEEPPEKLLKMSRLSKELGRPVNFKIRALSYNQINEFVRGKEDSELLIVLEGLAEPDLRDKRLLAKFGALTPLELLRDKRFLRPGEVISLSRQIEQLSGYREDVFEDAIKN